MTNNIVYLLLILCCYCLCIHSFRFCPRMCLIASPEHYAIDVKSPHKDTAETAVKHIRTFERYRMNHIILKYNELAFSEARSFVDDFYTKNPLVNGRKAIILDSGCGTGLSSKHLAQKYPHIPVIGVDRSLVRLTKSRVYSADKPPVTNDPTEPRLDTIEYPNLLLIRADLEDIYLQAALQSDWVVEHHYILYPNPYPKAKHLKRRWHGKQLAFRILFVSLEYMCRPSLLSCRPRIRRESHAAKQLVGLS
jgi:tRNA G46 methylase TrmB